MCFIPQVTNSSSDFHAAALTLALQTFEVAVYLLLYQSLIQSELSSSYPTDSN